MSRKGMEDEIVSAYERRRNMVLELPSTHIEWRNGIEPRWSSSSPNIDEDPPSSMQPAPIDNR